MIVGVPIHQGRVSPVLDTASRLLVVTRRRGREAKRKEFVLGVLPAGDLARSLVELGIEVLLCAAVSEPLRLALERGGVHVETHLCGEVEALLRAFCAGNCRRREFRMPGCWESHRGRGPRRKGTGACCHPIYPEARKP